MEDKIYEQITNIITKGNKKSITKLICMFTECITKSKEEKEFILMDLHIISEGYHFNLEYLAKALFEIGGQRSTPEDIKKKFSNYGLIFPDEVTMYDMSYVIHMLLSDYSSLNLSDSTIYKLAYNYITDPDYPALNGKAFAEWRHKQWLKTEVEK